MKHWILNTWDLLKPSRKQIVAGVVFLCISLRLIVASGDLSFSPTGQVYAKPVLVSSVGVMFLNVLASYIIINLLLVKMDEQRVKELQAMDYGEFMRRLKKERTAFILDTYTELVEDIQFRPQFLDLVQQLDEAKIKILILNPYSAAAQQRNEELSRSATEDKVDLQACICKCLRELRDFEQRTGIKNKVEIKVYDASPSLAIYATSERLIVSFFPIGRLSRFSLQADLPMASEMGQFLFGRFNELWEKNHDDGSRTTISLDAYFEIDLSAVGTDIKLTKPQYVRLASDKVYVAGLDFTLPVRRHGIAQVVDTATKTIYKVVEVESHDEFVDAKDCFEEKYGHTPEGMIMRLEKVNGFAHIGGRSRLSRQKP